mgnify:CR=1 FL=1
MKPYNARVVVPIPGRCVQLSDTPQGVLEIHVQSLIENTGYVCIGGPGVRARAGERNSPHMDAGETFSWKLPTDLSQWWIDATVANEGVCILGIVDA